jgi:hypothetical protein
MTGLEDYQKKFFMAIREYFNGTLEGEKVTDAEIVEWVKKVYNKKDVDTTTVHR